MRDREVIALAAALFPLGRLLWRAGRGPPGRAGKEFLEGLGREELKEVAQFQLLLDGWEAFETSVSDEKYLKMGKAIMRAASVLGNCSDTSPGEPMVSVFTLVDIGSGEPRHLYYKPIELDLSKELPVPGEKEEIPPEQYASILKTLEYYLRHEDFHIDTSRVLGLIERFLTFVPACTSRPAVSFYDYSRLLSALAVAIYVAESEGNGEKPFLFVEGDLSGIQRFIFRITSKGALKMLRARSIYLDLLSWDVVIEILNRLGLPRSCVLYNGGGAFTLIVPNTQENVKALKSLRDELERFLLRNFDGQLYLAIEWEEVSLEEMESFRDGRLWSDLKAKVGERKSRRFLDVIDYFVDPKGYEKREECAVCRKQITKEEAERFKITDEAGEELKLCKTCYELWHLGTALPKAGFSKGRSVNDDFVFIRIGKSAASGSFEKNSVELPFSRIYWYGSARTLDTRIVPPGSQVLLKNSLDVWKVPKDYDVYPYVVADYAKLIEENDRLVVMDFEKLAENAVGANKIGVFKADVDNLGLIFSRGLPERNPALVVGLSRLMDYFFKAYLRALIAGDVESSSLPKDIPRLPTASELGTEKHKGIGRANIVVIYAGGDDLFIVGAWNEIFNLAFLVRETFRQYSGYNPNITMSAGIATFNHDFPVSRMAQIAEERLELAKDEGKNRIFLIERTVPIDYGRKERFPASFVWDDYIALWRRYVWNDNADSQESPNGKLRITPDGVEARVRDKKGTWKWMRVPKSQLWKILELRELYTRDPTGIRWNYMLAYHLERAGLVDVFGNLVPINVVLFQSNRPQPIYWLDGLLKPLLFVVRR